MKICGDLKEDKTVTITGLVTGGTEEASLVQWYKTSSAMLNIENGLQAIGVSSTEKVSIV